MKTREKWARSRKNPVNKTFWKKNQKCLDENNKISVQFLAGRLGEKNLGAIT